MNSNFEKEIMILEKKLDEIIDDYNKHKYLSLYKEMVTIESKIRYYTKQS